MRQVNPKVDTFHGLNNALNPSSAEYRQGMAYRAVNSRINESGIWDKAPGLVYADFGTNVTLKVVPSGTGTHFKEVTIKGSRYIVAELGDDWNCVVGPNKYGYVLPGAGSTVQYWDGTSSGDAGLDRPSIAWADFDVSDNTSSDRGGRMERGTYYYMFTYYDSDRKVESLPSSVRLWEAESWGGTPATTIYPEITLSATATTTDADKIRLYRSKRSYEPEYEMNPPNDFYFIEEKDATGAETTFEDFAHDAELIDRYEGRGTAPPDEIDYIASFENRMYYFTDNTVYWSSSGRPEEVAQEYTLYYQLPNPNGGTAYQNTNVPMMPVLARGQRAEAKYEISELEGQKVVAAYPYLGKLWVWTADSIGYLKPTNYMEGVKYTLVRKGLGIVSDKTLAHTPYGLFGADRDGVWQLDMYGNLFRLSKYVIDLTRSDTYCQQSTLSSSFGVWCPEVGEYWWCVVNTGESTVHRQLAYQPARGIFSGSYTHPGLTGGCTFTSDAGMQALLTGGVNPSASTKAVLEQALFFWNGQHDIGTVKENVEVEIIYESITAGKTVSVSCHQNSTATTSGATVTTATSHTDSSLVGKVKLHGSGRMFRIAVTIPSDCEAPIVAYGWRADYVPWEEKKTR